MPEQSLICPSCGKPAAPMSDTEDSEILEIDAEATLREFGLDEHLTPQRANGLRSMIRRIRAEAQTAIADTAATH